MASSSTRPAFGLHAWALVALMLGLAVAMLAARAASAAGAAPGAPVDATRTLAWLAAAAALAAGVPLVAALVAWRLSSRSRDAASGACTLASAAVVVLGVVLVRRSAPPEGADPLAPTDAVTAAARDLNDQAGRQLRGGGRTDLPEAATDHMLERYDDAAARAQGIEADVLAAGSVVLHQIQAGADEQARALEAFGGAGGFDLVSLEDAAAVAERRRLLVAVRDSSRVLADAVERAPETLRAALVARGASGSEADAAVAGFVATSRLAPTGPLRRIDERVAEAGMGQLDILERHFGRWRVDPANGALAFDHDVPAADVAEFKRLRARVAELAQEQADLQASIQAELDAELRLRGGDARAGLPPAERGPRRDVIAEPSGPSAP